MSTGIIIDCHNIGWTSAYAMAGLEHEGQPTNVLFGFFREILYASRLVEHPATLCFCWDSKKSRRKILFPEYKKKRAEQKRSQEDEALFHSTMQQLHLLRDVIIPQIGFKNTFFKVGFEADDIAACLTQANHFDEQLVLSTDGDLLQLLSDTTSIYSPRSNNHITQQSFIDKYGIPPTKWAEVKTLAGCSTDEVPGIPGVGEKRAIDYILGVMKPGKILTKIDDAINTRAYLRDQKLVTLPFAPMHFDIQQDCIRRRKFFEMCKEYNFMSFMRKDTQNEWRLFLDMV